MKSLKNLYKIGSGPSSSHTMGPEKACEFIKNEYPNATHFVVTLFGSLALTGRGHLTDYIIKKTLGENNVHVIFNYETITSHPNTMIFDVYNGDTLITSRTIVSIGGGSIEIIGEEKSQEEEVYPFKNFEEIKNYCIKNNLSLADVVYQYEDKDIKQYLLLCYKTMEKAIEEGLNKTGELPGGLHVLRKAKQICESNNKDNLFIQQVCSYAFAVSEQNASGGKIVTAPTCGASGVLPATLYYYKKKKHYSYKKIVDALAVAGLIGNVIKTNASISGAFAGCQSEVGSACSMAAAGVSYLLGKSIEEIEYSAEIALEHHLGLTCDPIDGLVQIPCIERNAVAALRAIDASNLASLLNGTRKISFDMVVKTMLETGKDLSSNYKETSMGGLAKNYCK